MIHGPNPSDTDTYKKRSYLQQLTINALCAWLTNTCWRGRNPRDTHYQAFFSALGMLGCPNWKNAPDALRPWFLFLSWPRVPAHSNGEFRTGILVTNGPPAIGTEVANDRRRRDTETACGRRLQNGPPLQPNKLMGQLLVLWTQCVFTKIRVEHTLFPPPQWILRAVFGDRCKRV